ncbi:reverse transcriptase domain-containing protein [Tanacetum coccineum]|uniref:Reverse transcriptase domain-containing protein n=1 Tax=Tanacetum coccineum TaxID=301880 RepID=A0ABQ4WGB4_9ASTR
MFPPCYGIGPLHLLEKTIEENSLAFIKSNLWKEESECLTWLDSQAPVYNKWGVAMEIDNDVKRDEVGKLVVELLNGEKGNALRKNATKWKKKAEATCVANDGSSVANAKRKRAERQINAVKARLIYGEESGVKIRSREESHYSESKTPTARTEPRRRRGDRYSRSPSPHVSVFKRLKKDRSLSPRPRPRKEGGCIMVGKKGDPATPHCLIVVDESSKAKRTVVETRKVCQQKRTPFVELADIGKENYLQQTKHIKDPVEIHHIKQRDGESMEDFMERLLRQIVLVAKPRITQSFSPETAMSFPPLSEEDGTESPMIVEVEMGGYFVHMVYIDGGASSEVLYIKLRKEIRDQMVPATTHLIGFSGETIWPLGQIALLVKIGDEVHSTSAWMNFMVIRSLSQHNAIIGRLGIRKIRVVPSTAHGMLKFPVEGGTVTLQSSRVIPMECAMISGSSIPPPTVNQVLEEKINIAIHPEYPEQTVAIGSTLTEKGRKELCSLLKQNLDIFAWKPADMTGVPRNIAEHRLNIREGYSPVRQKKRGQAPERNKVIQEEVEKLVDAGIMKEVHYHSWLSNPVMVKKHDGTWRMCVDFKDLNNACPKDCYPLPEIDWKVESLCGYSFKCFLDAYKGYHQIKMAKEDEEKTAFITSQGIFCYSKMPFGLKNAGSTYQRLVDKAFQKQIGRNLEVYVDDLVIKSRTEEEVIRDITETFKTLRQINMKLNPKKCTSMQESIYLGYKVSTNGLRACSKKADAVLSLPSLRCIKDVQKLNGKLASLNRFLSKSAEKSLPFFKTLKNCTKKSDFQWTPEAEEAFKQMKKLIAELPTLTAPREREELIIYLAAAKEAISAVLMTDREGRQIPVYFVSRTLRGPEVNYTPMEKLVLALLSASKRLKRYFQAHTVVVITSQPIKQLLSSSEISGRMLKWKFELEGYDIQYRPRTAIKGQILADFIVERPEDESPDELMAEPEALPEPWTLFTDGSSCVDGSGAGLILTNPEGAEFTYAMRFRFEATNNEAEYEALIAGLRIAEQMGVKNLQANVDSRLVANQVNGFYTAKEPGMVQYLNKVKTLTKSFKEFSIKQIPRSENKKADALSKIASTSFAHLNKQVLVEELKEKSINEKEILDIVEEEGNTWMTPICEYLTKEILPEDKKKARTIWPTRESYQTRIAIPVINHSKICVRICHFRPMQSPSRETPASNGLVERANRRLGEGIKARLDEKSKD